MPDSTPHDRHTYLDFDLEIGLGQGREYPVAVLRSPAGEARETMRFPFDELQLESRLKDLQIALLRSGGKRRRILSPEEQAVQAFGGALFNALFTGEVRSRYDVSQERAAQGEVGLRIKLRIAAPELAALPWEFLYDSRQADFVCLSRNTPVVRYLECAQPVQPLAVTPPLRILGLIASPSDQEPLDVGRERQRVEDALKSLVQKGTGRAGLVGGGSDLARPAARHARRAVARLPFHRPRRLRPDARRRPGGLAGRQWPVALSPGRRPGAAPGGPPYAAAGRAEHVRGRGGGQARHLFQHGRHVGASRHPRRAGHAIRDHRSGCGGVCAAASTRRWPTGCRWTRR